MSNLFREPSKDVSYQVLIRLATRFQRRIFFRNQPIRNKNDLWRPCLLMDRDKMSSLYKGPSIDASYQVSVHLAEGFQRRRLKCEKLTDDGRRTPSDGKSSHCLWQGELKMRNLLVPTKCTGLGPENWFSSWGLLIRYKITEQLMCHFLLEDWYKTNNTICSS